MNTSYSRLGENDLLKLNKWCVNVVSSNVFIGVFNSVVVSIAGELM